MGEGGADGDGRGMDCWGICRSSICPLDMTTRFFSSLLVIDMYRSNDTGMGLVLLWLCPSGANDGAHTSRRIFAGAMAQDCSLCRGVLAVAPLLF